MMFGLVAQVVIFTMTVLSYAIGMDTFFNNPAALNQTTTDAVPLARAVGIRAPALIVFPILNAISATIGWALGGLLPGPEAVAVTPPVAPPVPLPPVAV
jgi:hypothetical protein